MIIVDSGVMTSCKLLGGYQRLGKYINSIFKENEGRMFPQNANNLLQGYMTPQLNRTFPQNNWFLL
jgi:hypothetical protein